MAIPTYDLFIEPILRFLAKHPDGVPAKMAHDAAADALGLSTEEKAQMLTSGTQQIIRIAPAGLTTVLNAPAFQARPSAATGD